MADKGRVTRKLHVKAYWLSESGNVNVTAELQTPRPQEIRYLPFADKLSLNYAKLNSELSKAFGIPQRFGDAQCKLQLFWKGEFKCTGPIRISVLTWCGARPSNWGAVVLFSKI